MFLHFYNISCFNKLKSLLYSHKVSKNLLYFELSFDDNGVVDVVPKIQV